MTGSQKLRLTTPPQATNALLQGYCNPGPVNQVWHTGNNTHVVILPFLNW